MHTEGIYPEATGALGVAHCDVARDAFVESEAREQAEGMLELAKTSPAVLAAFLADLERFQNQLTDIIVLRQAMRPDDEMAPLISALALTAVRSGLEKWAKGEAPETEDTPMPHVERAAALVNSIFTK